MRAPPSGFPGVEELPKERLPNPATKCAYHGFVQEFCHVRHCFSRLGETMKTTLIIVLLASPAFAIAVAGATDDDAGSFLH
jgi:hypothetical protein